MCHRGSDEGMVAPSIELASPYSIAAPASVPSRPPLRASICCRISFPQAPCAVAHNPWRGAEALSMTCWASSIPKPDNSRCSTIRLATCWRASSATLFEEPAQQVTVAADRETGPEQQQVSEDR